MNNIEDSNLCKFNKKKMLFQSHKINIKTEKKNPVVSYKATIINNKYFI